MKTKREDGPHPVTERIRKILNDRNLTQTAVAEYAGMSQAQFSKCMTGRSNFNTWQLSKMANGLGMRLIDLFTYPDRYQLVHDEEDEISASITIQLKAEKKDQALKLLFGDKNLKLLNNDI